MLYNNYVNYFYNLSKSIEERMKLMSNKKYIFCFINGSPYYCAIEEGKSRKYFAAPNSIEKCLKIIKNYYLSNGQKIERPNMKMIWNTLGEIVFKCKYNPYYNINNKDNIGNSFEKIFTKEIVKFMNENPNIFIKKDFTIINRELREIISQTGEHLSSLKRVSPIPKY